MIKNFGLRDLVFNNTEGMKKYKSYLENNEIKEPGAYLDNISKPVIIYLDFYNYVSKSKSRRKIHYGLFIGLVGSESNRQSLSSIKSSFQQL
jgi:hypothetical protein